ncbi:MAG: UvrD-helicase domain-containing protein [Elusimicrobia bacterium]|nr:UvrD-helicase domain-containing protein [Elusimicrobiota bacterium]
MADPDSLNPEQREAVSYRGGPLLVLAGAGTGKTRVIVHRVASLIREGAAPERILAVTFTNKAAEEMRRRVDALAPGGGALAWVYTFHAFAARILRSHAQRLGLPRRFTIYDQDDQKRLVAESIKELGLEKEKNKASLYVSLISRAKDDLLDAQSYAIYAMAQNDPSRETVARVYEVYQKKLSASGGLDFGDLLLKLVELFRGDAAIRELYQERFLHLLVDEYQDTNHAQYIITKTLASKHRNLCVVGDPDQSIYSWRGAHVRNILEFESDFPNAKVVRLERNYRSTPNILQAASLVIEHNRGRLKKSLWTERPEGPSVEVEELADEREEARSTARRAARLLDEGFSPKDMAVFYRTNAQSRSFEEAFTLAQIPHRVVGSVRFYERKEVKDALAYARAALNPADSISLSRILNVPPRGLGKASQEALEAHAKKTSAALREALEHADKVENLTPAARQGAAELVLLLEQLRREFEALGPADAMEAVLQKTGYWAWLEGLAESDPEEAARMENLQELLNAVREFEETCGEKPAPSPASGEQQAPARAALPEAPRIERFLESAALQTQADAYDANRPSVTLMTVHLAKGLEFPAVFLTGLEEGLFPISSVNTNPEELEEERRLCYVGMTRAKERLTLLHAATRRVFGRVYSNLPSRFIFEAGLIGRPAEDAAMARAHCAPAAMRVKAGMRVRHPEFGCGEIVEKSGSGEMLKVTVAFDSGATKKLLLRYAPLSPA